MLYGTKAVPRLRITKRFNERQIKARLAREEEGRERKGEGQEGRLGDSKLNDHNKRKGKAEKNTDDK